jgi:hypothetical protein
MESVGLPYCIVQMIIDAEGPHGSARRLSFVGMFRTYSQATIKPDRQMARSKMKIGRISVVLGMQMAKRVCRG